MRIWDTFFDLFGPLFRARVFVSHSTQDRPFAERLARDLQKNKEMDVFLAEWDIVPGENWAQRLLKELRKASAGVVVLSADAANSQWVMMEWAVLQERRTCIPVLCRKCAVPDVMKNTQVIDFTDPSQGAWESSMRMLQRALDGAPPGDAQSERRGLRPERPTVRLGVVFASLLIIPLFPVLARSRLSLLYKDQTYAYLRRMQEEVQVLDAEAAAQLVGRARPGEEGELIYRRANTGPMLVSDVWSKGRLAFRNFYREGRLIARDEFQYQEIEVTAEIPHKKYEVTGKVRSYMDEYQRVTLIDHFTQGGVLQRKSHVGAEGGRPTEYMDDFRSPIPLPSYLFYR